MDCANKERNEKDCSCSYTDCERHGICCECVRFHRAREEMPNCLR